MVDGSGKCYLEVTAKVRAPMVLGWTRFDTIIAASESRTVALTVDNYGPTDWIELRADHLVEEDRQLHWLLIDKPATAHIGDQNRPHSTLPRQRWATAVTIDGSKLPLGRCSAVIELTALDVAGNRFAEYVSVSASRRPPVQIIPQTFFIPDVGQGEEVEKQLLCVFANEASSVGREAITLEHDLPFPVKLLWKTSEHLENKLMGILTFGPVPTTDSAAIHGTVSLIFEKPPMQETHAISVIMTTDPASNVSIQKTSN